MSTCLTSREASLLMKYNLRKLFDLVGKSIKVKALPGLYENSFHDGKLGIIVHYDDWGSLFTVVAYGETIYLTRGEFEIL